MKTKNKIALNGCVHGSNLYNKIQKTNDAKLKEAYEAYIKFRKNISNVKILNEKKVGKLVNAFNQYRNSVLITFEERPNSGQENIRSSMLEEFFFHLFNDLIAEKLGSRVKNLVLGRGNGYVDLTFSPKNFIESFSRPGAFAHSKDQDFLVGAGLKVQIGASQSEINDPEESNIIIPILAIECKTYIERNMLDSCAGTAGRLKKAMPYCLYIVVAEYMKLEVAQPELTDIDEVFILCKATNSDREKRKRMGSKPHLICNNLVVEIFQMFKRHINKVWWDPSKVLSTGKVINRP